MPNINEFFSLFAPASMQEAERQRLAQEEQLRTAQQLNELVIGQPASQDPGGLFVDNPIAGGDPLAGFAGTPGALPEGQQRDFISTLLQSGSPQFAQEGIGLAQKSLERIRQGQELRAAFQGTTGLQNQLQQTALIPERFGESISNLRQLETVTPKPDFTNFTVDDTGQAFGFNVKSRQVEKIPQVDLLTKYRTVQGIGDSGLPEIQLVRTSGLGDEKRISFPKGMTPEAAGKKILIESGLKAAEDLRDMLFKKDGSVNRSLLINMNLPFGGTPRSEGRSANVLLLESIEAKLRAETGAAAPDAEVERLAARFRPSSLDNDDTIKLKSKLLIRFLKGTTQAIRGNSSAKENQAELDRLRKKHGL